MTTTEADKDINTGLPPGPSSMSMLRTTLFPNHADMLPNYERLWHEYGDISYGKIGPMNAYVLNNPADIHHVLVKNQKNYMKGVAYETFRLVVGDGLVTSEGQLWRKQRRLMQPPFTATSTQHFMQMMTDVTQGFVDRWETMADTGKAVNVNDEMMRLTTSVIGRALFDIDLSEVGTEVGYAFQEAFAYVPKRASNVFSLPLSVPLPKHRRFQNNMRVINEFVDERIAEKRRTGHDESLLSKLMQAKDKNSGYMMDQDQLRDEVITLFFAGFETTARSLTWLWYMMGKHPDVAEKVAAEAISVLDGRQPTIGDMFELKYSRMVVDEILRIYAPVAIMPRQPIEDDEIGGYHIPAGSLVFLMVHIAHKHPDYWQDPHIFDPERFSPERSNDRPKYAYIPFANGQRICLGNNFALLEMVLAASMALNRFRLGLISDEDAGIVFGGTVTPDRDIMMTIERR